MEPFVISINIILNKQNWHLRNSKLVWRSIREGCYKMSKEEEKIEMEKCVRCDGKGTILTSPCESIECPICHGKGEVKPEVNEQWSEE